MKKLIALLLALTMVMGLVACGNNTNTNETTTTPTTEAPAETNGEDAVNPEDGDIDINLEDVPAASNGASDVINAIWNAIPEDKKFFAMGGDMNNMANNAAGVYSLEDEGLTSTLLIPAEQIANVDEAASLVHAMMLNNFTCGAFHVTGDAAAFAEAMHTAIANNQWICGMPEKMVIAIVETDYVIACFGINDAVAPFEAAMNSVYGYEADVKYSEAIGG